MGVVILVGPKGSGKTHVGRLLERELGWGFVPVERLALDAMRSMELSAEAVSEQTHRGTELEARRIVAGGRVAVLESLGLAPPFLPFLQRLRDDLDVRLVALRAPLAQCARRVAERDAAEQIPVSAARVGELNRRAAAVALDWDLEIDNPDGRRDDELVAAFRDRGWFVRGSRPDGRA